MANLVLVVGSLVHLVRPHVLVLLLLVNLRHLVWIEACLPRLGANGQLVNLFLDQSAVAAVVLVSVLLLRLVGVDKQGLLLIHMQ